MSLREAAEQALRALIETQEYGAFTQGIPDAVDALRAALAEAPKAEPVAWMHNQRVDCIHNEVKELLKRAGGHLHRPLDKTENYTIPLYAHAPAALPESAAWTPVTTRLPPYGDEKKVVCHTEGHDYAGTQFITLRASDFYKYDPDESDEPGTPEAKTVSHWIYEDDLIAAARGKG